MPYGTIKVDNITFTNGGSDTTITVSGLASSTTGNLTVTGTISGAVVRATTVSGATVTGTAGQFDTITGNTAGFTTVTGTTITGTTLTVASGTFTGNSTAAAFIPTGSTVPTNGVYLPAANSVAISTGGSGRLFVDASGNVGIGAAAPATAGRLLDINGITLQPAIQLRASSTTSATTGYTLDAVNNLVTFTSSDWPIRYFINGSERLRITSAGLVGVGTSSPGRRLVIAGDTNTVCAVQGANNGTSSVFLGDTDDESIGALTYNHVSNHLEVKVNGAERVRVDSSGRVGVGTTSPSFLLDLFGTTPALRIKANGVGNGIKLEQSSATGDVELNVIDGYPLVFKTSNTERLRIDSSGRVGIGTSSPSLPLHVVGAIASRNTTAGMDNMSLQFVETGSGNAYGVRLGQKANASLAFEKYDGGWSETVRIDSAGRVGIGSTSDPGSIGSRLWIDTTGDTYFTANTTGSGNLTGIHFRNSNGNGEARILNNTGGALTFYRSPGNEAARIDSSGRWLVGTSSSSAEAKFIVQGGATAAGGAINIQRNATTASAGSTIGFINFTNSANNVGATLSADGDGTWSAGTSHPTRLVFSTTADGASSPTERMRIGSTGVINVFSSISSTFIPRSSAAADTSNFFIQGAYGATNTTNGTVSFQIFTNGNVQNTNNSYGAISDIKLKENIVDANSQWDDLKALQVRKYNFKEGQTHTQIGLIAQEVELVSPGLVTESPDRDEDGNDLGTTTKSINYSVLYMKAVKALQEAMERIETLEASNADLLARVSALESA